MITRVYIDNFRCFSNFEVRPERVNLLIGDNGTGKSTFIEVLHGVVELVILGEAVEEVFPANMRTQWDSRTKQRVELEFDVNGSIYIYEMELSIDANRESVSLHREMVKCNSRTLFAHESGLVHLFNNDGTQVSVFPFRGSRSFLPQLDARTENELLTRFLSYLGRVWLIKLNPTEIGAESLSESESLDADGLNFASWYRNISLEQSGGLDKLFLQLREILPGFLNLRLLSTGKGKQRRELAASFTHDGSGKKYDVDFDDLSDGERSIIILYSLLLEAQKTGETNRQKMTFLLDEPENYVGLKVIQPWLRELADAMRYEGQLFVISHHPEVIDYLAADHTLFFERPSGGPTRVRLDPFSRDDGLKPSELILTGEVDAD